MFETSRLRIRVFRDSDLDRLDEIHTNPEAMRYMGQVRTREQSRELIGKYIETFPKNGFTMWALEAKADGDLVGLVSETDCLRVLKRILENARVRQEIGELRMD